MKGTFTSCRVGSPTGACFRSIAQLKVEYNTVMDGVTIIKTAITLDALSHLRDKETSTKNFRYYSQKICYELLAHAVSDGDLTTRRIVTPVEEVDAKILSKNLVIIPIFRAGLAFLPAGIALFPQAKFGFVGLARDEETAVAHEYYWKVPDIGTDDIVLITDPMLATGGSLLHVLQKLAHFSRQIRIISVIAAPEGIEAVRKEFPDIQIITGAVDKELNAQKYIVPGLGDYGDRYFGTA